MKNMKKTAAAAEEVKEAVRTVETKAEEEVKKAVEEVKEEAEPTVQQQNVPVQQNNAAKPQNVQPTPEPEKPAAETKPEEPKEPELPNDYDPEMPDKFFYFTYIFSGSAVFLSVEFGSSSDSPVNVEYKRKNCRND